MDGWIKFWRLIVEWRYYTDANTFRVFFHLITKATHKPIMVMNINLMPGQLLVGRKALAKELKLSEQEIRTALKKLKNTGEVTSKATNKFSIITVCNWGIYQSDDGVNQPTKQHSTPQKSTTNKNRINNTPKIWLKN